MFKRSLLAASAAALLAVGIAGCGNDDGKPPPVPGTTISTLSNRADLISGGSALVEIRLPASIAAANLRVDRDGVDMTSAFAVRSDGRITGLVSGLAIGPNTVSARSADGSFVGARLTITNHSIGGPVLVATQASPFVCATPVPSAASGNQAGTNASGLSTVAVDAQCNIATEYKLWYRTKTPATVVAGDGGCSFVLPDPSATAAVPSPATPAVSCLQPYAVGSTAASLVASTTTSTGLTLPYIVRLERGTIDRGIYDLAVLYDPTKPAWTGATPQPQWNGKVLYGFGPSTGQPRQQYRSEQNWINGFLPGLWDDTALRLGYLVADNSMTDSLYNSNRVVTAETTMMMKEHIVDNYGEIKYVAGIGCSGGSLNQNNISSLYPGLLDGIQPSCDFSDSITTAIEISDCVLLLNVYTRPEWQSLQAGVTAAQQEAKKTAIEGHRDSASCRSWFNAVPSTRFKAGNYVPTTVDATTGAITPSGVLQNNCMLPTAVVYDAATNPGGVRCGEADAAAAIFGTTTTSTGVVRALTTTDNTGVQYGLKALLFGVLSPEEFVTLNEKVGGYDVDFNQSASRATADAGALAIAYRSGYVSSGKNLAKVAIIDSRGNDEEGIHLTWRSFSERARLDRDAGSHGNQVLWRFGVAAVPFTVPQIANVTTRSFLTMDTWLSSLIASVPKATVNESRTQAQVVAARPSAAVDLCYLTGDDNYATPVYDLSRCDADSRLTFFASPRQAAGGPQTEDILKCQLKPLALSDYPGVAFSAAQQTRLNAAFPTGVCDWSKPGVGQQDPVGQLTFGAGPGGTLLGAPPTSTPL